MGDNARAPQGSAKAAVVCEETVYSVSELCKQDCQIGAFEKHFLINVHVVKCNSSFHPKLGDKMNQSLVVISPFNFACNPT